MSILPANKNESASKTSPASSKQPFFGAKKGGGFFGASIQAKLTVNAPNDAYEQEADAVADQVVQLSRADKSSISHAPAIIQQKCSNCEKEALQQKEEAGKEEEQVQRKTLSGGDGSLNGSGEKLQRKHLAKLGSSTLQKKCANCEKEELQRKEEGDDKEEMLQTKSLGDGGGDAGDGIESSLNSSKGGGSSLSAPVRNQMESAMGADFSGVKIHTGGTAVQMSKDLNAQAFTHGSDIYFNEGKYNPSTTDGQHLLAHELTHVVQQNSGLQTKQIQRKPNPTKVKKAVTPPGDRSVPIGEPLGGDLVYYAIDADGDQVKELLFLFSGKEDDPMGLSFRIYHLQTEEMSPYYYFNNPMFDINGFVPHTLGLTNGELETVLYLSGGDQYTDPITQQPANNPDKILKIKPPKADKPGLYEFSVGSTAYSHQFKKTDVIEQNQNYNVLFDPSTASTVGFASGQFTAGPYYDRFMLVVREDSNENYTKPNGPYKAWVQLAGLSVSRPPVTFSPFSMEFSVIPSQLSFKEISFDATHTELDLDGDGKADLSIRNVTTQQDKSYQSATQNRALTIFIRNLHTGIEKRFGINSYQGNFYGEAVKDFRGYVNVASTESVKDLPAVDVPATIEEEIGFLNGHALLLYQQLVSDGSAQVDKSTHDAWQAFAGTMVQLLEVIAKTTEDTPEKELIISTIAGLADDFMTKYKAETKSHITTEKHSDNEGGGDIVMESNPYTGEYTMSTEQSVYESATGDPDDYVRTTKRTPFAASSGYALAESIRKKNWKSVRSIYHTLFASYTKWIAANAKAPTEAVKTQIEQLKYVSSMFTNIHGLYGNPDYKYVTHVKALFYDWSSVKDKKEKPVKSVPLPMYYYYDTKKKQWVIIDYIKTDRPFYVKASAEEPDAAKPEPPASLFKELNHKDHLPEGYMVYETPYGLGGSVTYTEPWEWSDYLAAVGLGLAAVGVGLVTFGTGTVAVIGGYVLVASAVATAGSAVMDMVDKSEHGQLTDTVILMDMLQIVTSLLQIKLTFAGMGKVLTNTTKFTTTATISKFFNQYYVPLKIASIAGEASQVLLMTAEAVKQLQAVMDGPGNEEHKKKGMIMLISQLTVTGGIYLLGLKGDISDLRNQRALFLDEFTGTDGTTKGILAHFSPRYATFADAASAGAFSSETFLKQFALHFPGEEAALTELLSRSLIASHKDELMQELFHYIRVANPNAEDMAGIITSLAAKKSEKELLEGIQTIKSVRGTLEEFGTPAHKKSMDIKARDEELQELKKEFQALAAQPFSVMGAAAIIDIRMMPLLLNWKRMSRVFYRFIKAGLIQAGISGEEAFAFIKSILSKSAKSVNLDEAAVKKVFQQAMDDASFVGYSADEQAEVIRYFMVNKNSELCNADVLARLRNGEIITSKGDFAYPENEIKFFAGKGPKTTAAATAMDDATKAEMDALKKQRGEAIADRDKHAQKTKPYEEKNYFVIEASEQIGEKSAEIYMKAQGFTKKFPPPGASPGAGYVDQVWEKGGKYYILEIKGGSSQLGSRVVKYADIPAWKGKRVQQGTKPYLQDVLASMERFGDANTKALAKTLAEELEKGNVVYRLARQDFIDKAEAAAGKGVAGDLKPLEFSDFDLTKTN